MRPLEGIKIIDFSSAHAAVYSTMILADFGADVLKIERYGTGDAARYYTPYQKDGSAYHAYLNRGKKSLSINMKTPEGKEIIKKLVAEADVVVENFRYGSLDKMGLGYSVLKEVKPDLIYAALSSFGQTGPLKRQNGLDLTLQAMGGIMDLTGRKDGPPIKIGTPIGDQFSGVYLALAIMLALVHRQKTGEGQKIDVAMMDAIFSMLEMGVIQPAITGQPTVRRGNGSPVICPYDVFPAADGYVSIGVSTNAQWAKFCKVMELDDLAQDPLYATNASRAEHFDEGLRAAIEAKTQTMSRFEIEQKLRSVNLPVGAVCTVYEASESEQIKARDMVVEVEDKAAGKVRMFGIPAKLSATPGAITSSAPLLGEHTTACLKELGYTEAEIGKLIADKVVEQS